MVDDVLCVQKCSNQSVKINAVVNAFIESKKLNLSKKKCNRIHVRKSRNTELKCPELKIHDDNMNDSTKRNTLATLLTAVGQLERQLKNDKIKVLK